MNKILRNNWIRALAVNVIIFVVIVLITDMAYETNDDYAIASRIAAGYPYVNFISYYLAEILIPIQGLFPKANIYVIFMLLGSLASFTAILKVILDMNRNRIVLFATVVVMVAFAFDQYAAIQFTKTSALMMTAGFIVMLDCLFNMKKATASIPGIVLIYAGSMLRFDGLLVTLGTAGVYLIYWLVYNRKSLKSGGYFKVSRIALYVILIALVGGTYGLQIMSQNANTSTAALKEYKEYSILRSEVVDYPVYEHYEEHAGEYESAGISENDLFLIDTWHFDYDGAASAENLKKISDIDKGTDVTSDTSDMSYVTAGIKAVKTSAHSVLDRTGVGRHIIILVLIGLMMVTILKPRDWILIVLMAGLCFCMYTEVYYMQRPAYRVMYIVDIGAAMWMLYHLNTQADAKSGKLGLIAGIITIIVTGMMFVPIWKDCNTVASASDGRIMSEEMTEYLNENDDAFFVFNTAENRSPESYRHPLVSPGYDSIDNSIGAGSWGTKSPYVLNILGGYGMENPIRDLVDNDGAYYVGSRSIERLEEYYNKWYGEKGEIDMVKVDEIDGKGIWSVKTR